MLQTKPTNALFQTWLMFAEHDIATSGISLIGATGNQ